MPTCPTCGQTLPVDALAPRLLFLRGGDNVTHLIGAYPGFRRYDLDEPFVVPADGYYRFLEETGTLERV